VSAPSFDAVARVFAPDALGATVRLRGWVLRTRSSGGILFLVLRDRTGVVQATGRRDALGDEVFTAAEHVQIEGAVSVEGTVAEDRRAPDGREVRASRIAVIDSGEPFPIFSGQTEEFLLDQRHLAIRSQENVAIFRVKAELLRAFREFLDREDVLEMTPPILSGNAAEGGAEAFQFDYFGRPGYLSQTAQLYLEALLFPSERVYGLTPSFRAEKSRTPRHLTEFLNLEIELAWCDLDGLIDFIERMMVAVLHAVAERRPKELKALGRPPEELLAIRAPVDRLRVTDPFERGSDRELKAFYMLRSPDDPRTVEATDLLGPEGYGEIVGASCRETDIDRLKERIGQIGAKTEEYEWYLDLRRHGNIPHAGFGLGVERVLRWMLRREHIRDTTPFPRTPSRHTP